MTVTEAGQERIEEELKEALETNLRAAMGGRAINDETVHNLVKAFVHQAEESVADKGDPINAYRVERYQRDLGMGITNDKMPKLEIRIGRTWHTLKVGLQ